MDLPAIYDLTSEYRGYLVRVSLVSSSWSHKSVGRFPVMSGEGFGSSEAAFQNAYGRIDSVEEFHTAPMFLRSI